MKNKQRGDWTLRFVKGALIGSGFILPGVSGAELAAVFGIYERMISFVANITKDFKKNVLFFLPVGLGGLAGIFLLSFAVSFFLGEYEGQIRWFFVGCIVGTLPALWRQAGKRGRGVEHIAALAVAGVLGYAFMRYGENMIGGQVPLNTGTWLMAGGIIGLSVTIPGLSSSTFLVYLGMYKAMADGIKSLDFSVIIPIFLGAAAVVLLFSKLMDALFARAYAGLFHCILGIVVASTVMIIPAGYDYRGSGLVVALLMCAGGIALGFWMSRLEDRYKPES